MRLKDGFEGELGISSIFLPSFGSFVPKISKLKLAFF